MNHVCVFGAGAVGQFLAVSLATTHSPEELEVTAICRNQESIASELCVIDAPSGTSVRTSRVRCIPSHATGDLTREVDVVICCLKGHHLPTALPDLLKLASPNTLLLFVQNGIPFNHGHLARHPELEGKPMEAVDPEGALLSSFDPENVGNCVTQIAAARSGQGEITVRSSKSLTRFLFGGFSASQRDKVQLLMSALERAGVNSSVVEDMLSCIWRKLLVSASVNTTNALTHGWANALIADKGMLAVVKSVVAELMAVGVAAGAVFEESAEEVTESMRARFPKAKFSMLQDVEEGRELEVDAIVCAAQHVACMLSISTPIFDTIAALILHYRSNLLEQKEQSTHEPPMKRPKSAT